MASIIEIRDKKGDDIRVLSVELSHVLALLEDKGPKLLWSILELYTMGYNEEDTKMWEIEQRLAKENIDRGVTVKWDDLWGLARSCKQIIDTVIVGYEDPAYQPKLSTDFPLEELYKECEIVIELIDGDVWRIFSRSEDAIKKLNNAFQDTLIITKNKY